MSSLETFLHMGGYGFYVWSSYAIAAVVLIANVIAPIVRGRTIAARLARRERLATRDSRWESV